MTDLERLAWNVAAKLHANGVERTAEQVIQHCVYLRKEKYINNGILEGFLRKILESRVVFKNFIFSISYAEVTDAESS